MKSNIKWIALFVILCALCAVAWIVINNKAINHKTAVIKQDGQVIKEIDLKSVKEPYEFEIKTNDGHSNTVRVEYDKIAIVDADCADKVCVNTGYISNSIVPIVCLPHKLSITIEDKDKENDFDGIVGKQ